MEQPEQTKGNKRFIEIEAPYNLEVGQNFYYQPPFDQIVVNISSQTASDPESVRRLLTSIAKRNSQTPTQQLSIGLQQLTKPTRQDNHSPYLEKPNIPQAKHFGGFQKLREISAAIGLALTDYPLWNEYIDTQHSKDNYQFDGRYSHKGPPALPESYARWVTKKIAAQKSAVLEGIEEVFPQQSGTPGQTSPHGEKPQTNIWQILRASELIREKR